MDENGIRLSPAYDMNPASSLSDLAIMHESRSEVCCSASRVAERVSSVPSRTMSQSHRFHSTFIFPRGFVSWMSHSGSVLRTAHGRKWESTLGRIFHHFVPAGAMETRLSIVEFKREEIAGEDGDCDVEVQGSQAGFL